MSFKAFFSDISRDISLGQPHVTTSSLIGASGLRSLNRMAIFALAQKKTLLNSSFIRLTGSMDPNLDHYYANY
jgi:hypothetical protein